MDWKMLTIELTHDNGNSMTAVSIEASNKL